MFVLPKRKAHRNRVSFSVPNGSEEPDKEVSRWQVGKNDGVIDPKGDLMINRSLNTPQRI